MVNAETVIRQADELGIALTVAGDKIRYRPASAASQEFVEALRDLKPQVIDHLRRRDADSLKDTHALQQALGPSDSPFPIGYGGLPLAQVGAAEAFNDTLGIVDPIHRKYNILAWCRGYYQNLNQNRGEHYEALQREQRRLSAFLS